MPITLYQLSYVERSDPSTSVPIHQLLNVSCWNQCRQMRMYVFGLIMTSFLSDRVFRLSYSLRPIRLTPSESIHALRDHVEFYMSTTSSSLVETSFKSFKLDHNFHFKISSTSVLPLYSGSPSQISIFQKPSMLRTLCIQNPAS